MKYSICILIVSLFIFSCKSDIKKTRVKSKHKKTYIQSVKETVDDTAEIEPSSIGCLPKPYSRGFDEYQFSPGTFNDITYVYNSIKPGSKKIDSLPFNTSVNILKEYFDYYLVCTTKAKSGYIKKTDLFLNKMFASWDMDTYDYLVGITKYPPRIDRQWNNDCKSSNLKIIKIDQKGNILDTYTDSVMGGNYSIKSITSLALKKAKSMFHVNYNCMQEIETDEDLFIVDNGKKLSRLFVTSSSGDGGYGDGTTIYLPVTLVNGKKIVLAKEGMISVDLTTAKPEIFPYPVNCGIPIDELVVVQSWSEADTEDETGPKYNKDGSAINYITITSTTYYRWDGNKLTEVKTIKGK